MNIRQLTVIHAVCETGSFSTAARQLGVTQPALSKMIARTEAQLGFALFERVGSAIKPTAIAELIHERAAHVLSLADKIDEEVRERALGLKGVLRIGYGPATRVHPLPALLGAIADAYPDLRLMVRQAVGVPLAAGVQNGKFDLAISYSGNADAFGDLIRTKLFGDDMVLFAVPDHPLHAAPVADAEEFLRYPIASMGIVEAMRAMFGKLTSEQHDNLYAFVCDNASIVADKVLGGTYVGIGPRFTFGRYLTAGTLREIPHAWPWHFECWMITSKASSALPVVRAVAELARNLPFPAAG